MSHSKRPNCSSSTENNGAGSHSFSSMKKARPHQQQTLHPPSLNDQFDDDDMLVDGDVVLKLDPNLGGVSSSGHATTGVAANLSRKKATPPQPAKKLIIKFIKDKPKLPINFEEDTWAKLKSAITAIFLKLPDSCDSEKLYQAVSDLCLHKMGGNLYRRIQMECEAHISITLHSLVGQSPDLVVFISLVEKCWQDTCNQMLMIRGIALYLDTTYVKQMPSVCSLWDMGLQLFRKHLSLSPEVEHKTVTGLLRLIEKER